MSQDVSYLRGIATKARQLQDEAPDRAARELLSAVAKIFEAEAERITHALPPHKLMN